MRASPIQNFGREDHTLMELIKKACYNFSHPTGDPTVGVDFGASIEPAGGTPHDQFS